MNPDTGELRRLRRGEAMPEGFDPLPRALTRLATLNSAGAVDLTQRGRLQNWAKKKRKAKIAAASRRRNRK